MVNSANLLVVEVKPANGDPVRVADDLEKLTALRRKLKDEQDQRANYHAAYFWVYHLHREEWRDFARRVEHALRGKEVDLSLIRFFLHENAGVSAVEVAWQ
jgi:hypothetical protein